MTRVADVVRAVIDTVRDPFSADSSGLPEAATTTIVDVDDGGRFALRASAVAKSLGGRPARMLAYNGSIPGPTIRVAQGSRITVDFTNDADVETTVHWHGIRLDNRFDGVPLAHGGMQTPTPVGGSSRYALRFPDPGIYWYHPHVREDYTQELGLYGNILVTPTDPAYWPRADRELLLVLDDVLVKGDRIAPFSRDESNRTAMGRYGNVMLVNGQPAFESTVLRGEVVRLFLTNTANVRPFRLSIPGARMKLVGADGGRVEREAFIEDIVISPSERAVVDVLFETAGEVPLEHRAPGSEHRLATFRVLDGAFDAARVAEFEQLRTNAEYVPERSALAAELDRDPDRRLQLVAVMPGMRQQGGGHGHADIEWEDTMALHNRMTNPRNMFWKLVDQDSGAENQAIRWAFREGDRIKLRIENTPHSDHPMQHPFHVHGQRFLVIARNGSPPESLAWKDTVLIPTGQTVDLLIEMANPGTWMAHCHIAEHLEAGMMLSFAVDEGSADR